MRDHDAMVIDVRIESCQTTSAKVITHTDGQVIEIGEMSRVRPSADRVRGREGGGRVDL